MHRQGERTINVSIDRRLLSVTLTVRQIRLANATTRCIALPSNFRTICTADYNAVVVTLIGDNFPSVHVAAYQRDIGQASRDEIQDDHGGTWSTIKTEPSVGRQ